MDEDPFKVWDYEDSNMCNGASLLKFTILEEASADSQGSKNNRKWVFLKSQMLFFFNFKLHVGVENCQFHHKLVKIQF